MRRRRGSTFAPRLTRRRFMSRYETTGSDLVRSSTVVSECRACVNVPPSWGDRCGSRRSILMAPWCRWRSGVPELPIRVLLCDDHKIVRSGLRRILLEDGIDVVGEAGSIAEVVTAAARTQPDVVVLDLG